MRAHTPPRKRLTTHSLSFRPSATPRRAQLTKLDLTDEEKRERDELLAAGFSTWSRREYKLFTNALERFGREARDAVIADVVESSEKPAEEVARYYDTFLARKEELVEWKRLDERVARGEAKIKRRVATEAMIHDKVLRARDSARGIVISYVGAGGKQQPMKGFTEEEDRWLLVKLSELGYGAWEEMRYAVRRTEQFRFDWFL
jgi:SWI/SNF-related matrix-associated actin-dependent regulator of chromatin subfamily A member 5